MPITGAKVAFSDPFYYQLMHIMLKNTEFIKYSNNILECFNNSVFFNIMYISW